MRYCPFYRVRDNSEYLARRLAKKIVNSSRS